MKPLIKIFCPIVADELSTMGFPYAIEEIDGQRLFVFIETKEMAEALRCRFPNEIYVVDDTLCF